ncbi:MAG: sel1 repeat family protein [Gammaproteobacteria bacterium]|nr:sel1 repeat family protein [Gammaproteobacteria bacterium]NIR98492.1 sel1 repeat family protein [Gammaproteobacteria bacterium]NIT64236.1 sel1 repeat family protein [Gammaproteobacteria bacterium]NIV21180.1 hypothetical protein [Gammaproteobacteria bacterium]NIX10101.1 hypothetical protein [Gammaproteobacteria bacterium]
MFLALVVLLPATALADAAEDTKRGVDAYNHGDVVAALRWLRQAAEQGHAPAAVRLAYILDKAEQNEEAVSWYRAAAEQGNAEGAYGLGQMYAIGEGVEHDPAQAVRWVRQAADGGVPPAMRTMAEWYRQGQLGLPADLERARAWLHRAAQAGDPWAMHRLAKAYEKGELGLSADPEKARHWREQLSAGSGPPIAEAQRLFH